MHDFYSFYSQNHDFFSLEMVVAWQSIAVGAGYSDDGLREIFILHRVFVEVGHVSISENLSMIK